MTAQDGPSDERRRSTKTSILDTALQLFNQDTFARISTNRIASELGISPGNLYYHFKSKEQIAERLVLRLELKLSPLLEAAGEIRTLEDLWVALHLGLEALSAYQFIFRDADYLVRNGDRAGQRLRNITRRALRAVCALCEHLREARILKSSAQETEALASQIFFTAICWESFNQLIADRGSAGAEAAPTAAFQIFSLFAPHLDQTGRAYLARVMEGYLA